MKGLYMLKYLLALSVTFVLCAQDSPKPQRKGPSRPQLSDEQKKQRAELVAKYDTNKDGKLDKEERAKVSDEDRKKLRSFGPPGGTRGPRKDGDRPSKPKMN